MARSICLSLPEELYRWLEKEAKERNKRIQEVIRELLTELKVIRRYRIPELIRTLEEVLMNRYHER